MPLIKYRDWRPGADAQAIIEQANSICRTYANDGDDLTLRQLYYQFVARDLIPNDLRSYKRLGDIVNNARLAGLLDWHYIVDRTRNVAGGGGWDSPAQVIDTYGRAYGIDKWEDQPTRIEVWVEKEALAGVVSRVAGQHNVAHFSCRGYVSQSEMWGAARRFSEYVQGGQSVLILHLGDHDPSGIDMSRDITDRLSEFMGDDADDLEVRRIALNMDQITQYNPPPNPAKTTDARAEGYIRRFGHESWELDALDPRTLRALIGQHIEAARDDDLYATRQARERRERDLMARVADRWDDVVSYLASAS